MHTKGRGLVPPKKVLSGHKKPFKMTVEMLAIFLALIDLSSLVAQSVKSLPAMQETWVQSLCREDPLEKKIATHSSVLTWRIPWAEEPGRLQSMGSQRVGHNWVTNTFTFIVLPHFGVILKNLDLWNNTFLSNSICQPIIYLLHVSFCFIWFSDFMVYKHIKTCLNELRFPSILSGEGNGTPRQYSCLENPMDAGA